jgi:uncharacterized membrane protein
MALAIAGLGLWYWLARGHRLAGIAIAVGGIAWTVVAVELVIPQFASESPYYSLYDAVGGSPAGVVKTAVTDPAAVLSELLETGDLAYLVLLGAPLVGVFLVAPGLAAIALPSLLANALSASPAMTDPRQHYVAAVVPFLIAAAVLGVARLPAAHQAPAAAVALALGLGLTLVTGPQSWAPAGGPIWYQDEVPAGRVAALRAALDLVPGDARVTATNKAGSHLSARRYVYSVPVDEDSDWIVLDVQDPWIAGRGSPVLGPHPDWLRQYRRLLETDPAWTKVFERDGVLVFRRAVG